MIDRKQIIRDMARVVEGIQGNQDGVIPAFNVFVQQLPIGFWNGFSERLTRTVPKDLQESAEWLLVNAARECGYHTGYGIITSDEWNAVVQPMVEGPEDTLRGAFAVLTAWGWAKADIIELTPGESMTVRAYDYYEADVVGYGASTKLSGYMLRGICGAFMDLAYGGPYDPTGASGMGTFTCVQTKGIECGDDYGEFVVTRA